MNKVDTLLPVSAGRDEAGCLTIAGHSIRSLAEQYGTPLYLYDGETIEQQVTCLRGELREKYPGESEITYAAKAYFSLRMARHLASLGLGVDVVSRGELAIARRAGFEPKRVHLHGNNKSIEELTAALDWGVQAIVVDSLEELEILAALAEKRRRPARVWLRISPGVKVNTHAYMQTSHHASKFGLTTEGGQAAEAVYRLRSGRPGNGWLHLSGLHTHLGSQFFEAEPYRQAIASLMELAEEMKLVPEELSPGGGWGVPYVPEQPEGAPGPWISTIAGAVQAECKRRGWPLPRLVIEPGRWLVARAGVAVYTVGTTKTAGDGTRFVAVDGGIADNPRPALYQAPYTALLADRPDAPPTQTVTVVGKFCESGDQLISDLPLPDTRRGDLLVMPVAGAYHLSMASNYNLAPRPAALWLERGRVEVLQKREHPENGGWWSD